MNSRGFLLGRSFRSLFILFSVSLTFSSAVAAEPSNTKAYREVDWPQGWKQVFPGGDTICARGNEFSFFYHPGNDDNIVIDFVGGGACWSAQTCDERMPTFTDSVESLISRLLDGVSGIYDHENVLNPVNDWSHVVIPYCTGDIHWGDNVMTYGEPGKEFTVFHKGAVNAKAVLEWTMEKYTPSKIFLTGTSAGGYASIYWLPYIREHAPQANIIQFSDSAVGVATDDFFQQCSPIWNPMKHAPAWIPSLDPDKTDWSKLSVTALYQEVGRFYPDVTLSQFNTNFDEVQSFFYQLMGGKDTDEWAEKAVASLAAISEAIPNFSYFHSGGDLHTIIPEHDFYALSTNDIKLVDWLDQLIDTTDAQNIMCTQCENEEMSRMALRP